MSIKKQTSLDLFQNSKTQKKLDRIHRSYSVITTNKYLR